VKTKFGLACAVVAAGLLSAAGASAATTFADFSPASTAANIALTGGNLTSSSAVLFAYTPAALQTASPLDATLTLNASEDGTALAMFGSDFALFTGNFAFTYTGPTQIIDGHTVDAGDDLLSGSFTDALFTGQGHAASLLDSSAVSFNNNSLLTFGGGDEALAFGATNIDPSVSIKNSVLANFTGVASGNFSSGDLVIITGGTPEPATWAMMLLGLFGLGTALRLRPRLQLAA
jgi:hypothetical protein